jgi:hypothetical protein
VNPAPGKVRAAAYQVFKTTKGVSDLGRSKDPLGRSGQKLALHVSSRKGSVLKQQLLVDTSGMTLLAEYTDLNHGGKATRQVRCEDVQGRLDGQQARRSRRELTRAFAEYNDGHR